MSQITKRIYNTFLDLVHLREQLSEMEQLHDGVMGLSEYKGVKFSQGQNKAVQKAERIASERNFDITPMINKELSMLSMELYNSVMDAGVDVFKSIPYPELFDPEQTAALCSAVMTGEDVSAIAYPHIPGSDMLEILEGNDRVIDFYQPRGVRGNAFTEMCSRKYQPNSYSIFQIRTDHLQEYGFVGFSELKREGRDVKPANYTLKYVGDYRGEKLDRIYYLFNEEKPADFLGHSMSVSDVIVITDEKGKSRAYYCDRFGFEEIQWDVPEIDNEIRLDFDGLDDSLVVLDNGEQYLVVDFNNNRYFYGIYDSFKRLNDGGELSGVSSMKEAIEKIVEENGINTNDLSVLGTEKASQVFYEVNEVLNVIPLFCSKTEKYYHLDDAGVSYQSLLKEVENQLLILENELGPEKFKIKYGPFLCGSRSRGLEQKDSDIDIVFEYEGSMREDDVFNILHSSDYQICYGQGIKVDINPLNAMQSGTIQDYLIKADRYLEQKAVDIATQRYNDNSEPNKNDKKVAKQR